MLSISLYHSYFLTNLRNQSKRSIPFTVEDISKSMQQVDVNDIEPPQLIRENSGFGFLLTRKEGSTS